MFAGENFREFRELQAIRENIIYVLFFVDKDRALIHEDIIREMLYLAHSRKFSPAKISRYTVTVLSSSVNGIYTRATASVAV